MLNIAIHLLNKILSTITVSAIRRTKINKYCQKQLLLCSIFFMKYMLIECLKKAVYYDTQLSSTLSKTRSIRIKISANGIASLTILPVNGRFATPVSTCCLDEQRQPIVLYVYLKCTFDMLSLRSLGLCGYRNRMAI